MDVYDLPGSFSSCFFFIISTPFSSRDFVASLDGGGATVWSFPVGVAAGPLGEVVDGALTPVPGAAVPDIEAYAALRLNELALCFGFPVGGGFFTGADFPTDSASVGNCPWSGPLACGTEGPAFAITALSLEGRTGGPCAIGVPPVFGTGGPFAAGACPAVLP